MSKLFKMLDVTQAVVTLVIHPDRELAAKFKNRRTKWLEGRTRMLGRKGEEGGTAFGRSSSVLTFSVHRCFRERLHSCIARQLWSLPCQHPPLASQLWGVTSDARRTGRRMGTAVYCVTAIASVETLFHSPCITGPIHLWIGSFRLFCQAAPLETSIKTSPDSDSHSESHSDSLRFSRKSPHRYSF